MFGVYSKLGWFFRENWRRYAVAVGCLSIVNVLQMFPPKIVGMTIDGIHQQTITNGKVFWYAGVLLAVVVLLYSLGYIWQVGLYGGANLLERKLRYRFMNHILKMTPSFFEKNRTGDLMARATNDLKAIMITAGFGILSVADSVMYTGMILCMMGFTISWELTILAIIPLPILAFVMKIYGNKLHKHFNEAQDAFGNMNDSVLESVSGTRVIRAYVQEKQSEKSFAGMTEDVFQKNRKVAIVDSLFDPSIKVLVGISYLIGLGYGAKMVFEQSLSLGDLVSFNVYLGMLIWPMFAIGELMNLMQRGNASLDRLQETLGYKEDVPEISNPAVRMQEPDDIRFTETQFRYPSSAVPNLQSINFELPKGNTLGIVGKTGSGKTTLIRQLLREYPMGDGKVTVSDIPLEKLALMDSRGWLGYVPQEPFLFSKTVRENIIFGCPAASEEELYAAITLADFEKDVEMLPNGLETLVGEKGVGLSGGQKQRISIARALISNPSILLLDDSLSAVDAKTEQNIIGNIRKERAGKTTWIVSHRMSSVEHADVIIVMDKGSIIEVGKHEELLDIGGWYREQYERQRMEKEMGA